LCYTQNPGLMLGISEGSDFPIIINKQRHQHRTGKLHSEMRRVLFLTKWELDNLAQLTGNTSRDLLLLLLEKNAKFFRKI